jgi:putative transposase
MPWGLKRYYGTGALHFITSSCYQRQPFLGTPDRRDLLLKVLELMRDRYRFVVIGYVVMPEHVHLLMSEPQVGTPSTVIQAIKLGFTSRILKKRVPHFSRTLREVGLFAGPTSHSNSPHHLWQARFYDFNLWSQRKEVEKLRYMHRNPVVRGLVQQPEDWKWSSFRSYAYKEAGLVTINDWSAWEEKIRLQVS